MTRQLHPKPYINLCQDLMFQIYFSSDKRLLLSLLKSFLPLREGQSVRDVQVLRPAKDGEAGSEAPDKKKQRGFGLKERSLQDSALDAVQEEDSMLRPPYPDLKVISLDLFVSLSGGEKVNVEMQTVRHPKFIERMLYYWAGAYTKHLKRGDLYSVLKPVYSLVFADFSLFPQAKRSVTSFSVRSDDPPFFPLTHDLCMVFTDLTKNRPDLKKTVDNRGLWRYFLKESREMDSKDLKLLASKNEEMKMAVEQFKRISEEEKVRGQELLREKAVRDYISWHHYFRTRRDKVLEEGRKEGVQQGRKEGRKEGMQKGRKEGVQTGLQKGRKEIALNMLKAKIDASRIAQMTGLSEEEIQELQSK